MRAATRLFAQRGYETTTTREIAASAGCAEGLIHRYFRGKAGLLFALIQSRVSREVEDLSERLELSPTFEEEVVQLVNWELDRQWEDRDFLRVIIPRALVDPAQGRLLNKVGASRHGPAMVERLKQFPKGQALPSEEIEALAEFVKVIGFVYGFMQPMVRGRDRDRSRKVANTLARILARVALAPSP
jgi:AcrR family transcriptional regulator